MDKYYQLLDANSANVSPLWKVTHVTSMVFATISGFISAYTLGKAIEAFGNHCILFPHIVFLDNTTIPNTTKELPDYFQSIDMPATDWGKTNQCYFCQFTPVMSMISGLIWSAFFIIFSKGGAGYISDAIYRPWRIIYPAIVFTVIAIGLLLFSTVELSSGIAVFCAQFKNIFNTTTCTYSIDEYTLLFNETEKPLITLLDVSFIASVICIVCWISQLLTLILRIVCVADFEMFKITVTYPNDSEEILQDVVDPDDHSLIIENIFSDISIASNTSYFQIPNHKYTLFKFRSSSFFKRISKFNRKSPDQQDVERDDNISLNKSNFSSKFNNDNRSVMEKKTSVSSSYLNEKKVKRVSIGEQDENEDDEDIVYSSLFFGKKEKHTGKLEHTVPKESLTFVPHHSETLLSNMLYSYPNLSNTNIGTNEIEISKLEDTVARESSTFVPHRKETFLSNVLHSHPNQSNTNIVIDENEISNSTSNEIPQNLIITSAQINSTTGNRKYDPNYQINNRHDDDIDSSSSTLNLDFSSFISDKQQLFDSDISKSKLIEQKSEDDLNIKLDEDEQNNYSTKCNSLMNGSQQQNSLPIQLINYEPSAYTDDEKIKEDIIAVIDRISNENVVISYNQTATMSNYDDEYVPNLIQNAHLNEIPVKEDFDVPETSKSSLSIFSFAKNSSHENSIPPSNLSDQNEEQNRDIISEPIDSNYYYVHDSNSTILGLRRSNHRMSNSQNLPHTIQGSTEENAEIPPYEFREHINENMQTEGSDDQIRHVLLTLYIAFWLSIVLRNVGSLIH